MEWISGNIFIRPNDLPKAGDKVDGHPHNFDHTTIVYAGKIKVVAHKTLKDENGKYLKDENGQYQKGEFIAEHEYGNGAEDRHVLIKADVLHEITALEDNTVFWCVYSHRTPQGDVIQKFEGWLGATV